MIQDAVDSATNADTVLVYPGIYYENVDITDKGIVLASTWLLNPVDSLINQTIIDGNYQGSCVRSTNGSTWAEIIGLTLQHGTGTNYLAHMYPHLYGSGGGIYAWDSRVKIIKCNLLGNFGWHGAGIYSWNSQIKLSGNTIFNNWAARGGGGIRSASSSIEYDSINLNNVYLNYGTDGSDIAVLYNDTIYKIWLDTGTVINPEQYYIGKFSDHAVHMDRPPISVLHGKIEQFNHDLYVSPAGCDSNSGLTPDDPLKTISFALLKIASDSIDRKTVHVANGIYSNILTGEHTPLQLKNYINLVGQSRDSTIIDCENKYEGARFAFGQDFSLVRNISFNNGNGYPTDLDGGISTGYSQKLILDSIALVNTTGNLNVGIYFDSDDSLIISNSLIYGCTGCKGLTIFNKPSEPPRYVEIMSTRFSDNYPDTSWDSRQMTLSLRGNLITPGMLYAKVINCLFNDNTDSAFVPPPAVPIAILSTDQAYVNIVNCTFANNTTTSSLGAALVCGYGSIVNTYNSIFYGNETHQIALANTPDQPSFLSVDHSLIEDGLAGIINNGGANIIDWGDCNLDADPLFLGSEEYPYALDYGSPCIDAGTLDLPPGITLPEYDLAGNPRIWGESVDMGAYEYGPWVRVPPVSGQQSAVSSPLQVSPNPFSYGTYVSYESVGKGRLRICVYSLSGMMVRSLINSNGLPSEKGNFYWDGTDNQGNDLPAGVYLIEMTVDDEVVGTVKVVKKF